MEATYGFAEQPPRYGTPAFAQQEFAAATAWQPRVKSTRPPLEVDTECYPDWWLFKCWLPDGRQYSLTRTAYQDLNVEALQYFVDNFTWYTFNGENYDEPMITLAMRGATNDQLKHANDLIIKGGLKRWQFYDAFGLERIRNLDHVDLMEPTPGVRVGLKTYMGRAHCKQLQDLPYKPDELTTLSMRQELDIYCGNDLDGNRTLRGIIDGRLKLREVMGERYGVDMRSKSDAQMAEAIIKAQLGFKPEKRIVPHGWRFKYEPPAYIRFTTPRLQQALQLIKDAEFISNDVDQLRSHPGEEILDPATGEKIKSGVIMPLELKDLVINIGRSKYKLGIGGLHSQEQSVQYHTIPGVQTVQMDDVASYYPSLIINLNITPEQLGSRFQEIYRSIYAERIEAKGKAKLKTLDEAIRQAYADINEGFKIVLNGTFGKLGSKYSIFYSPELLIKVTLTGQLCLLMLIEMLEAHGISVVSANTDGIVTVCPAGLEFFRDGCIRYWSGVTGLVMESEAIRSLYARDVNSYVAIMTNGDHKGKGAFAESGVLKNVHPSMDIVRDSVIEFLKTGKHWENTIRECQDIRQFLVIRSVKGGGNFNGQYLGKTVRWYYGANPHNKIVYESGNKVAGSDGAQPCMRLPDSFPVDVDYARYEAEAVKMLETLGVTT